MTTDQQLLSAFGQGESRGRKGGYLSDNPHAYGSEPWSIWREGYAYGAQCVAGTDAEALLAHLS